MKKDIEVTEAEYFWRGFLFVCLRTGGLGKDAVFRLWLGRRLTITAGTTRDHLDHLLNDRLPGMRCHTGGAASLLDFLFLFFFAATLVSAEPPGVYVYPCTFVPLPNIVSLDAFHI